MGPKSKAKKGKSKNTDFKKVKVKVGRKLPRAQNETVATFQTRSILLKTQTKGDLEFVEPAKQKVDLDDVLKKCSHKKDTDRTSAVNSIRNLFVSEQDVVLPHLHLVFEKTAHLLCDRESNVRDAFIKLLRALLQKASFVKMRAFLPLLSAHLCAAMMNLNGAVRWDAHGCLDLLIESYPEQTCQNPDLVENLLLQMSALKSNAGGTNSLSGVRWKPRVVKSLNSVHQVLRTIQQKSECKQKVKAMQVTVGSEGLKHGINVLASNAFKFCSEKDLNAKQVDDQIAKLEEALRK